VFGDVLSHERYCRRVEIPVMQTNVQFTIADYSLFVRPDVTNLKLDKTKGLVEV
jgi:hypothetical protein